MYRLLFLGMDTLSAAIPLLPFCLAYGLFLSRNRKNLLLFIVTGIYLAAVCEATGLPSVTDVDPDIYVNLIPFYDIISDLTNCILNVMLFIPLGVLLPAQWKAFQKGKNCIMTAFLMSFTIEVLQLFNYRTSDVNDLMMNTLGAVIGFGIWRILVKIFPHICNHAVPERRDLYVLCGLVLSMTFFLQPFVSRWLWDLVLIS